MQAAERCTRGKRNKDWPDKSARGTHSRRGTHSPHCGPSKRVDRCQPSSAPPIGCVWARCSSQNNPHSLPQNLDVQPASVFIFRARFPTRYSALFGALFDRSYDTINLPECMQFGPPRQPRFVATFATRLSPNFSFSQPMLLLRLSHAVPHGNHMYNAF